MVGTEAHGLNQPAGCQDRRLGQAGGTDHELLLPIYEDRAGVLWMGSYGGAS